MAKDDQIHIRVNKEDKDRVKERLKEYGKKTDFLIDFFLQHTDDTKGSLEIEKGILLQEINDLKESRKALNYEIETKEIRLKVIENQLNNTTLYDLENYKYNKSIFEAVNSLKKAVIERSITKYTDIRESDFKSFQNTYRFKDLNLFKNIVKNEFPKWTKEIQINNTVIVTKDKFIDEKASRIISEFKRSYNHIDDINEFVKTDKIQTKLKGYCKNYSKENPELEPVTPEEIINKILEKKVKR